MDQSRADKIGLVVLGIACAFGGAAAVIPIIAGLTTPPEKYADTIPMLWITSCVGVFAVASAIWSMFFKTKVLWSHAEKRSRLIFIGSVFLLVISFSLWNASRVFTVVPVSRFSVNNLAHVCLLICIALSGVGSMLRIPGVDNAQPNTAA